jgi:hypothetical protein
MAQLSQNTPRMHSAYSVLLCSSLSTVLLFFVTTTVVLQKALGRIFVLVQLCHSNDFGSLWLCSQFAIRVLALLLVFQLVTYCTLCSLGCTYSKMFSTYSSLVRGGSVHPIVLNLRFPTMFPAVWPAAGIHSSDLPCQETGATWMLLLLP